MQAGCKLPSNEGWDSRSQRKILTQVGEVGTASLPLSSLCQEQGWAQGPGLEKVLEQVRLQNFLIRNRS